MTESDCDIEYLDEDADIVQQCVQVVPAIIPATEIVPESKPVPQLVPKTKPKLAPLLVERTPAERKRKRRKEEEDSDYDPDEDLMPPSPPSPKTKKKKQQVVKKIKSYQRDGVPSLKLPTQSFVSSGPVQIQYKKQALKPKPITPYKEKVIDRKKCDIKIPDYDDPLCLPVRAIKYEESDIKRLNNWNNVCLEHFRHCDNMLKPERGDTNSSTRTVVFRNVVNKQSGKLETTIWSKTTVENEDGDKKSEIFQCVLPRYKEKTVLKNYALASRKLKPYHLTDEVILTKEDSKDGEVLVAYKPKETSSAVYKLVAANDKKNTEQKDDYQEDKEDEEFKVFMKELAYCKMCAPCYQTSWRGVKKNTKKSIACPICSRSFVTVYNLLTHFKTHSSEDMRKYKRVISSILAEIVDYHYKCRICRDQFTSIKKLRRHVTTHQGSEIFTCEVGNHMAR